MKRLLAGAAGVILAVAVGGWLYLSNSPAGQIYVPSGTGITAKQICSLTFVSGLDPERARALYTDPLLGDARPLLRVRVDHEAETVKASALGMLFRQTAIHREGLGCTLVHEPGAFDAGLALPLSGEPDAMTLDTDWRDTQFDSAALDAALDLAFTDDGRNTLAALVLHDGRLIAERYAEGVTPETPLPGWSMTKSFAATLAGVLVQRGLLDVHAEGLAPDLAANGREAITVDHLLRMTAGLDGFETGDGFDPASQMLFTQADMAHYAANRNVIHAPGEHWDYQSGDTILAGSVLGRYLGDTVPERQAALRRWLFEPLGMHHSVVEADEAGTLKLSSYMYASARDWARLAQLYLDGGRSGGEQIIPPGWADYVTTPTPHSRRRYGAGFWLNNPGLPSDAFMMDGFQSQRVVIIPSESLVIVRLGATNGVYEDTTGFVNAVITARKPDMAPE
ncbi:serine hydrolase [Alkalicaulis satelles]|uniref:Serine hydrolase n=1 Tax=Alkalicaulis satelles TaxID=2609175 RepID=A0A5M6ZIJ7_9PROT|nr:serine hydrolase [Alkalicaulis satelles]KAA5803527.1 serine hydrolase [Alkalicaulis satelles]